MLDNSSAFDTVDHDILIRKLQNHFYVGEKAIKLIRSYLTNRTFSVILDNIESKQRSLRHGVPQGSLLGPLLYILYVKEIERIATKHGIKINTYADDVQLYVSFRLEEKNNIKQKLEQFLVEIQHWMDRNFLKLNSNKTELKLFTPNKMNTSFDLNFNNTHIECTDEINLLGVKIKHNFDFTAFVSKKVRSCNYKLRNLWHIRNSLPLNSRVIMVTNLIISNLDYSNSLLACASDKTIKPLQVILNKAMRFIFNVPPHSHTTP